MSRVGSFARLSNERRALVAMAVCLTAMVRVGLAVSSFRRLADLLAYVPARVSNEHARVDRADVRWATVTAARQVPGTSCLDRALVAHTICRSCGHESAIHVGVDRESDEFTAHSWVESRECVVVGDDVDLDRFEHLGVIE
jgi:hypothetical protein